jgi:nitroreductase
MAIGVAAGYANVTAAMLGYGTGCCACYNPDQVQEILGLEKAPILMMGIGFKGSQPRREHHVTGEVMPTHKKEEIEVNFIN